MKRLQTFGKKNLCTINLVPGKTVYSERLIDRDGSEYRVFDPKKSKLAAAIVKGADVQLKENSAVLYLGASTGTTVSHVSDIIGKKGIVFAIDVAPRVVRDLVFVAQQRPNIAPILADAHQPNDYAHRLSKVDWLYQDIAAKDQVGIFLRNIELFLEKNGVAILCLKAKSVDITKKSEAVFQEAREVLEKEIDVLEQLTLEPYYKDHCVFVCKK